MCVFFQLITINIKTNLFKSLCKGLNPHLLMCFITNKENMCFNTYILSTCISDCHNLISVTNSIKGKVHAQKQQKKSYRSYENFDIDKCNTNLNQIEMSLTEIVTNSEILFILFHNLNLT